MSHVSMTPLPFIEKWLATDLTGKSVLDYACGAGRHGRLAHERGASVTFVDIDLSNVEDLLSKEKVTLLQADLEEEDRWPLSERQYDVVIVTNYLFRQRLEDIFALVAPGGVIMYQTFANGHEVYGKPSNPNFLLKERELREFCEGFDVLQYEQGKVTIPSDAIVQRLAAKRVNCLED
ncbi:class I SAM-dependent methyltransferase [Curvivirga aplysinae]|uniref:class I SAM-dependent methyltransferase n=1 Tax=Curvivirga aplysinae TaxID=2529852 RepID=UPI0012BC1749|nr:methyltransferase domain-containing protein [Curvivirga aplysinae]MTI08658.1 methyltransferase domain-containing protein [Curvivirga aplysinae]